MDGNYSLIDGDNEKKEGEGIKIGVFKLLFTTNASCINVPRKYLY